MKAAVSTHGSSYAQTQMQFRVPSCHAGSCLYCQPLNRSAAACSSAAAAAAAASAAAVSMVGGVLQPSASLQQKVLVVTSPDLLSSTIPPALQGPSPNWAALHLKRCLSRRESDAQA